MATSTRPLRFTEEALTCPPTGLRDATTKLLDFALITWAVAPEALARHLPDGLEPDVFTLDDGREVAFISAVPFRDADFHFHFAPFYKIAMGQTNYRAYVRHGEQRAVWFFGTTLTGFWIRIPRDAWKLPWHGAEMTFDTAWDGEVCTRYELEATSDWAPARLSMAGTDRPMGRLDGFADEEEAAVVLTHPLIGHYYRADGQVGSYSVWHDRLELRHAEVARAHFPLFEQLELIEPGAPPHSALVQRETTFVIFLPPRVGF